MEIKAARSVLMAAIIAAASVTLVGCGGSDGESGGPLISSAPSQVALKSGSTIAYKITGGLPPYRATSGNLDVATVEFADHTLSITGVAAGTAPISVTDDTGSRVDLVVTVLPGAQQAVVTKPGETMADLTLLPASLTIGNCTTRVPFIFKGGVGPYTIFTSDNFSVPVSAALRLDAERSYFFADTRYSPITDTFDNAKFVDVDSKLTIVDSESRTAVATLTTRVTSDTCPTNPLFKASPESANFRTSEVRSFELSGGSGAVPTAVTFADPSPAPAGLTGPVAEVVSLSASSVTVRALATVSATTLMTIAGTDGQRTSVVITVLPQP